MDKIDRQMDGRIWYTFTNYFDHAQRFKIINENLATINIEYQYKKMFYLKYIFSSSVGNI